MSDIPRARHFLQGAMAAKTLADCKSYVQAALGHMTREQPKFRAPDKRPPLTHVQVERCKVLRHRGLALHEIVQRLGGNTDIGRVSEAINGKRKGI
jgi:hypothetical protein